jgi:hypothetical protein
MVIADASDYCETSTRDDSNAVGARPGRQDRPYLQRRAIKPCETRVAAVSDQYLPVIRNNSRSLFEASQTCEVACSVVIDDFEAIACRVRDEDPPGLRIESIMIELRVSRVRYCDVCYFFERHWLAGADRNVNRFADASS